MTIKPATFVISATIAIFTTGCIVIAHELSNEFKQILTDFAGHHWVSESIIAIILFAFVSIILIYSERTSKMSKAENLGLWSIILAVITFIMMLGILAVCILEYISA